MNTRNKTARPLAQRLRTGLFAAATLAVLGGAAAAPALADEYGRRGGHEEEWRDRDHDARRPVWHVRERRDYVAPAPVYQYAPAPVYAVPAYPAPSLSFVFPFSFN